MDFLGNVKNSRGAMADISRAKYLERYLSSTSSAGKTKKRKSKEISTNSGRGMRLLDEDTFIQAKPGTSKSSRRPPHSDDEEEDDDDEEMDEIEKAIRQLNRKEAAKNKARKGEDAPTFKADSFVTIEGPAASNATETETNVVSNRVKNEIKEEVHSEEEENAPKRRRMDDGRKAGLVSKAAMKEEIHEIQERERKKKTEQSAEEGQQDAETRKRVTGFNKDRRKRQEDAEKEARKAREAAKQAELEQKYTGWNKGLAQIKEREERLEEMERTLEEGFTRYADDSAMNEHLKEQLHEEDPMAEYFRVKNHKVQMRTGVVYPTFKGQWLPNRYGIAPGYRWDGVDRSNGFESKLALEKNKRAAREDLAYRSIAECEQ